MLTIFYTVMNVLVFAFVGLLVWLYFKAPASSARSDEESHPRRVR